MKRILRWILGNPDTFVKGRTRAMRQLLMRAALLPLMIVALLISPGCATTSNGTGQPPSAPTPPQVTVANAVNALAQAVDGAVTSAIAARDQGKVSQADLDTIEAFAAATANTGKQVDAELRSSDAWAAQKTKILQAVTAGGLTTLKGRISPGSQIFVSSLVVLVNQISSAVGGPVL
jgi:hypothetical protein